MRVWTALANAQLHFINGMKLKDIQGTIRISAMLSARFAIDTRCIDTTEVNADERLDVRSGLCNLLPEVQELQGAGDGRALQRVPDGVCTRGQQEAREV